MPIPTALPADPYVNNRTDTYQAIRLLYSDATAVYNIPIPAGALVEEVIAVVTEVCDGSPTLTIGDSNSATGYMTSANIAPGTAATAGTPAVKRASLLAGAYAAGKRYPTADNVTLTWTKGTSPTTGAIDILVLFAKLPFFGIPAAVASTATP